jgi:urease accessory protein
MQTALQQDTSSWLAQLELVYAKRHGKTAIVKRRHLGPLTVQRPFYPEGDICHSYVLHPPGGVVGGDQLELTLQVEHDAHALVTTPASAKFYRSSGATARQRQQFSIADDGILEYLPQDTILFDASKVNTTTRIQLAARARYAGWEILCQGRPASGEKYMSGECRQAYEIYRQGQPLLIERTRLQGNSKMQSASWGLAGYAVLGTMLVTGANADLLTAARALEVDSNTLFSATLIQDVLVCRYLGWQGIEARDCFARVWQTIRPDWCGRTACWPRIWDT